MTRSKSSPEASLDRGPQDIAPAQLEVGLGQRESVRGGGEALSRWKAVEPTRTGNRHAQGSPALPRPTRLRSWWSWTVRNAGVQMTIMEAWHVHPTSMTVVDTRTGVLEASRPWRQPVVTAHASGEKLRTSRFPSQDRFPSSRRLHLDAGQRAVGMRAALPPASACWPRRRSRQPPRRPSAPAGAQGLPSPGSVGTRRRPAPGVRPSGGCQMPTQEVRDHGTRWWAWRCAHARLSRTEEVASPKTVMAMVQNKA